MKKFILLFAIAIAAIITAQAETPTAPMQSLLDNYIRIQTALAGDSLAGVADAAAAISATAKASAGVAPDAVAVQAEAVAKSSDIKAAREAFKPLSGALIAVLSNQKSITGDYYEAFCPMANASWIQTGKKVSNPYFGAGMSSCGEIRKSLSGGPQASLPAKSGMGCCGS
jgi:Cu(I)/Ag(I) efflux system membrane fusion protein